ncbi:MAG: DUF3794 domain-containing protein [Oscillospiraceae bacterium]|nr:DUF3794 domain-containing protein [Oscillospiraceae bacterium]
MDASLVRKELMQRKTIYDGSCEIGVETALVLPDYMGDIEKILRCSLSARASSKRIEGQRLSVGGTAFMRMLYITSDGKVESFETQIPFSKNLDLNATGENPAATVRFETEYSNCLAVSPRRVELRGALLMRARVQVSAALSIAVDIDSDGVECKKKSFEADLPLCSVCENFTVMEEYELSAPISSVVRMSANPKILEHKIVSGRLIIKGEIDLTIVYISDEADGVKTASFTLPVNHFMSVSGAEEGDRADLRLEICRLSAEPIGREGKEIAVEVFLEAAAEVLRRETVEAVVDCYCIGHESACEKGEISVATLNKNESKTHQVCVNLGEEISGEVIDAFAEIKNVLASVNEHGEVMMRGELNAGLLVYGADGEVNTLEKSQPLEISLAADSAYIGATCDGDMAVLSVSRVPNKSEVCVILLLDARILKSENFPTVNGMSISSEQSIRDPKTAMTIYFGKEGEDVFDISKRYNTSYRAVMEQNDLDEERLSQNKKILIPMVKQ